MGKSGFRGDPDQDVLTPMEERIVGIMERTVVEGIFINCF